MKTMTTGIALAATLALAGCNSSESGSGGSGSSSVSLKTPTFIITESNRDSVDGVAYGYAGNVNANDQLNDTTSRALLLGGDLTSRVVQTREIAARLNKSETEACDSGSVTYSVSGSGINENTGEMQSNGSLSISVDNNACKDSYFNTYEDGLMSMSMSWSGYDGYDSFDSLSLDITFNNYTVKSYYSDGSLDSSESIHGTMDMSMDTVETSASLALSISSSEIDNKVVNIETTSPVKQRNSDSYPYTGTMVVTGGDNTTVTYTVVSNGVEVSLNGGQAELITWYDMNYAY